MCSLQALLIGRLRVGLLMSAALIAIYEGLHHIKAYEIMYTEARHCVILATLIREIPIGGIQNTKLV